MDTLAKNGTGTVAGTRATTHKDGVAAYCETGERTTESELNGWLKTGILVLGRVKRAERFDVAAHQAALVEDGHSIFAILSP
jgi:hypothetical protein